MLWKDRVDTYAVPWLLLLSNCMQSMSHVIVRHVLQHTGQAYIVGLKCILNCLGLEILIIVAPVLNVYEALDSFPSIRKNSLFSPFNSFEVYPYLTLMDYSPFAKTGLTCNHFSGVLTELKVDLFLRKVFKNLFHSKTKWKLKFLGVPAFHIQTALPNSPPKSGIVPQILCTCVVIASLKSIHRAVVYIRVHSWYCTY